MDFDFNKVSADMLSVIKGTVEDNWDQVEIAANQFFQRRNERLKFIAELRIKNELSQEKFESRLEDEKLLLEAEFNAITVISKAIVQKAANAAIDVFSKAVKVAIDTAL